MDLELDIVRVTSELETLAEFSGGMAPGVTRIVFSDPDRQAREWLKQRCIAAGLGFRADAVGNTFFRWEGSEPQLPAVATGSHIDAIPNSGAYDGTVGVLGGLEAIRALRAAGFHPRRSIELILFTSEEPTRFGIGCLGSRLLSKTLAPARADALVDNAGHTLAAVREQAGFTGALSSVALPASAYSAFVELHIEQGPHLERDGIDIGAVTHIAAPASLRITLSGEGGHAGAVLMPDRKDALPGAAELALAVESAATQTCSPHSVATTGVCEVFPGAVNSIPSRVRLELDVRDIEEGRRNQMVQQIEENAQRIAGRRNLGLSIDVINADPPGCCDEAVVDVILKAAGKSGCSAARMVSRAYHDTLFMSRIARVGMIFIPCRSGFSHRPEEYASPESIASGVSTLAHTLAELSSR